MTTTIDRAIDLHVPVETAYAQWTQFEDFPLFMDGIERIEQITDERLQWKVKRRGVERDFRARITEQHPNLRIAWTAEGGDGPEHDGVLTFHYLDENRSRVMIQLRFEPTGFFEQYADKMGLVESWVESNLESFKEFIEQRGKPTGSWNGRIHHDKVERTAQDESSSRTTGTTGTSTTTRETGDKIASVEESSTMEAERSTPRETASSGTTPNASDDEHRAVDHKQTVS